MKKQRIRKRFYKWRGRSRRWYNIMCRKALEEVWPKSVRHETRAGNRYARDTRKLNRLNNKVMLWQFAQSLKHIP